MQAGYQVIGLDTRPEEKPISNENFQFHTVDITSIEQTNRLAQAVKHMNIGVTVLINNAGIAYPYMPEGSAERLSFWSQVIQTNLTGGS